ncbi:hypothetical protein ACM41_00050 [Bradyrhizobium sp. CCBAU 21362]|nr:hypothetical protein [Bradyrhizobium sp. CCBAU 21362]
MHSVGKQVLRSLLSCKSEASDMEERFNGKIIQCALTASNRRRAFGLMLQSRRSVADPVQPGVTAMCGQLLAAILQFLWTALW